MTGTTSDATGSAFALPAGTVTFLLTDVEGSTRLWEEAPEAMAAAIPLHYELLAEAVARRGGVRPQEQGEGDSIVAAFARASDAAAAAIDAQLALAAQVWPDGITLSVRIALHTAEAQLRDEGNYFGTALSRCARLRGIAHGGQTVLSRTTHDLVVDRIGEPVTLVDLGLHRLRDLGRPEHVFGITHPDLTADFAPLQSLDTVPNTLPGQLTSFVGRERELVDVQEALRSTRLLTLTGAGGCGKTRLAAQAAADAVDRFSDGVWWTELAAVTDPALVGHALATAVGVRPLPGQTELDAVAAHLAAQQVLVVLDNCEHVLEDCARLVDVLLRRCPGVVVLATSRAPLTAAGETAWRVPSLSLPVQRSEEPVDALAQSDAMRLFHERALQVHPAFALTNETAPWVAQICHDLDGIPLAIELAAARVRVLSVEQIAEGLADRFRLLTGGGRSVLPRQRTLRASVDWSHELLDDAERTLLRRLAAFTGGWTLEAVETVGAASGVEALDVMDLLTSLVDKSLVVVDDASVGRVRYHLLETVRQYALDRLAESGEMTPVRERHRHHFLQLAERIEPQLVTPQQPAALDLLEADAANLASATDVAIDQDPDVALALCCALTLFWKLRGRFVEADRLYARTLDAIGLVPTAGRGRVLWARAYLGVYAGQYEEAFATAQEALEVATEAEDDSTRARALDVMATMLNFSDPVQAGALLKQCRALAREAGDDWCWADATQIAAYALLFQGRSSEALEMMDECWPIVQRMNYAEFVAWRHHLVAIVALERGDVDEAAESCRRGIAAADVVGEPTTAGMATTLLGLIEAYRGEADAALARLRPCLRRMVATGAGMGLPWLRHAITVALAARGELETARAELDALRAETEGTTVYLYPTVCATLALVDLARGDTARAQTFAALARAAADAGSNPPARAAARHAQGLTALAGERPDEAEPYLHEALTLRVEHGLRLELPESLDALATVALQAGDATEAARAFGAAAALRAPHRQKRSLPGWQATAAAEAALLAGDERAAYDAGAALAPDEAVAWIRRARGTRKRPESGWASLTPTEREVVQLAAEGLTNPQIGERLFIARATVKVHLSHVYAKLGVANRAQLAAQAARRDA